jgi:hypothetical protein
VFQEEILIFFEVVEFGHCEKNSYERFSDSELLLRERERGAGRAASISRPESVRFLFVGLDEE